MSAAAWFLAALAAALLALLFGVPFNSGAGLVIVLLWLVGSLRLATSSTGRPQR